MALRSEVPIPYQRMQRYATKNRENVCAKESFRAHWHNEKGKHDGDPLDPEQHIIKGADRNRNRK